MSDIFISYASSDRSTAEKFAAALQTLGWSVWWDRDIPPGKTFDQVIEERLNAASCVVVLWSKKSVLSRWVRTEASAAAERQCLVPVLIDAVAIPLEFKLIQAVRLVGWDGDRANPEFNRMVQAIGQLLGQVEPRHRVAQQAIQKQSRPASWWQTTPGWVGAAAAAMLIIFGLIAGKNAWQRAWQAAPQAPGAPSPVVTPPSNIQPTGPAPSTPASGAVKPVLQKGAFSIKIGDKIDDGVPDPGAGSIEAPYAQDTYVFTASAGQRVYFRMLHHSTGIASIRWRLVDETGMEVFSTCLGCTEPGLRTLTKGGTYTLTVGSDNDPATGTYQLQLFNVPAPGEFSTKIGDVIKENMPGPGAGVIDTPGAEDIYTFTATARQRVYFRMLEHSTGMSYIKWRLVDENGMEIFNTCLGCSEPGVQTLIKGGAYRLTVGNNTDPSTGTYRLQLFNVPPPSQFSIKIGDQIKPGVPGSGAGVIESPGAEDVYVFTASPGQKVYFHLLERGDGMAYNKWRLVDENGMEIFNTCLGCSEPGVQTLIRGGTYTLTVGSGTNPSTGNYAFEIGTR
jgi:TIR domain